VFASPGRSALRRAARLCIGAANRKGPEGLSGRTRSCVAQTSIRTAPRCAARPPSARHRERPGRRARARAGPRTQGRNRWGNRSIPASEDPSCSPLWRGETQGLGVRLTSGTRSSPSQGAAGRPLDRDRESLPRRGPQVILRRETERILLTGGDARARVSPTSGTRSSHPQGAAGDPLERDREGLAYRERHKGPGFAQPPGTGPLPCRERQRGSSSQGAAGHPLGRDRKGLPTRRVCLCAKNPSVKGSRPAVDPSTHVDSSLLRSPSWRPLRPSSARSRASTKPRPTHTIDLPQRAAGGHPAADPSNRRSLRRAPAANGASLTGCLATVHRLAPDLGP